MPSHPSSEKDGRRRCLARLAHLEGKASGSSTRRAPAIPSIEATVFRPSFLYFS